MLNDEFPDISAMGVKRIYPMIASIEPMRWTPMLHAYLLREAPGRLRQRGVQHLQFLDLDDLEALMSVLGPASWLMGRKIQEAGIDADVQQWFHDSPLAPQPERPAILNERLDRLFFEMITCLGFATDTFDRWKDERG